MPFDRRMIKQIVIYLHNGIPLRNKNKKLLIHATWVNFKKIILLSERNQTQKSIYWLLHFYEI